MKIILFVNSKIKNCGVHQYGLRTGKILTKSPDNKFIYSEIDSYSEFQDHLETYKPNVIIYNNHGPLMPWLNSNIIASYQNIIHIGILHEGYNVFSYNYDYIISQDPTINEDEKIFSVPRPLLNYDDIFYPKNKITTINSFGFSFGDKGFKRVVEVVCDQFDEAVINLHMPSAHFDRPKEETEKVIRDCINSKSKDNIQLNITRDFMEEIDLINFLASGDLNFFPYDNHEGRGISSVIDYALSVDRPIAITKSFMFRHIVKTEPSICMEDRRLNEIIESGTKPLEIYKKNWSNDKLIEKYDYIMNKISKNV